MRVARLASRRLLLPGAKRQEGAALLGLWLLLWLLLLLLLGRAGTDWS